MVSELNIRQNNQKNVRDVQSRFGSINSKNIKGLSCPLHGLKQDSDNLI